ncbi:MAG: hypothetical protein JXR96_02840 [Deltaproteobacteria bacterium]|nr:hypothetical protein [Deltaproteobacteria bacterium]
MRRIRWVFVSFCLLSTLALAGCFSESGSHDAGRTDGQDGSSDQDEDPNLCGGLPCAGSEDCVAGVCVRRPDQTAQACEEDEQHEYHCHGAADLSCHNAAACSQDGDCPSDASGTQLVCRQGFCGVPAPQGPETVTFRGCVDAFGIGDVTYPMRVAIYRAGQDPTGTSGWDAETTEVDTSVCEYMGAFEFENVPTNTPLVVKTYDPDENFITTYKYNVVLLADLARDEGGSWVFDTRGTVADPRSGQDISLEPWRGYAISNTTYMVILMALGITELPPSQGALAGTVRDCAYSEMQHVSCGVVDKPEELTYFNNSENPRPDDSRHATNVNGLYAAVGLEEGKTHTLACLARDDSGAQVPLGAYEFEVFGGGVTIISFDWYPAVD